MLDLTTERTKRTNGGEGHGSSKVEDAFAKFKEAQETHGAAVEALIAARQEHAEAQAKADEMAARAAEKAKDEEKARAVFARVTSQLGISFGVPTTPPGPADGAHGPAAPRRTGPAAGHAKAPKRPKAPKAAKATKPAKKAPKPAKPQASKAPSKPHAAATGSTNGNGNGSHNGPKKDYAVKPGPALAKWVKDGRAKLKAPDGTMGWTQQYLGDNVGVSQNTVSRWEKALSAPDDGQLKKLEEKIGPCPLPRA